MSHSPIIINEILDELRGDATKGTIMDVQTAFNAVETAFPTLPPAKQLLHEAIAQELQTWLTTDGTYQGAGEQASEFVVDLNEILS